MVADSTLQLGGSAQLQVSSSLQLINASLILTDRGAALLFYREVAGRGWEFTLRRFLDLHLSSDDVFIDVGAHWGIHALTAATRRRSQEPLCST